MRRQPQIEGGRRGRVKLPPRLGGEGGWRNRQPSEPCEREAYVRTWGPFVQEPHTAIRWGEGARRAEGPARTRGREAFPLPRVNDKRRPS